MTDSTNDTMPTFVAVPELLTVERLAIVQEQIRYALMQCYQLEATCRAIPKGKGKQPEFEAELKLIRSTLAGYRAIEAELIGRLNASSAAE